MKQNYFKMNIVFIVILLTGCLVQGFSRECGDVNSSGGTDIVDSLLIAQVYVGFNPVNYSSTSADVNADQDIDIVDALLIAQFYVGLISSLNCALVTPTPAVIPSDSPGAGSLDCSKVTEWSSSRTYDPGGQKVKYKGKLYENKWYAHGQNPEQYSGNNDAWKLIGACDPKLTPAPTPRLNGIRGFATRFWDCCKPHCAWDSNVPKGMSALKSCKVDGKSINPDPYDQSGCTDGSAYQCFNYTPWAVNSTLAYGFGATSDGDVCGKCYELQFTGEGYHGANPGAAALSGKKMIIQAINIGHDVGSGQVDVMIPGGGVGAFNGCSTQWGIPNDQLGAQYGGLLTACQKVHGHHDHKALKDCLRSKNKKLFYARGLTEMAKGLDWFINWYEAADNPVIVYKEVSCPRELVKISGMQRR